MRAPVPGTRSFILAIVVAQVLTQIGAFALPVLLPTYIECWHLTKIEAGWLIGIFFAAYVLSVPVLLALTPGMSHLVVPSWAEALRSRCCRSSRLPSPMS